MVKVDNGEGEARVVEIQLDENGKGSEEWEVPAGWMGASFATDDAEVSGFVEVAAVGDF